MATSYSDFIEMQNFLPVYDMADETPDMWQTFIPTKQFCDLLRRSLTAVTSSEPSKRRSMWVRGTFGTGKSHASSVVRHLLCDPLPEVQGYIQNLPDEEIKGQIMAIRGRKRFFPVVLKGVEGAYSIPRFTLSVQRETKNALSRAGHRDIVVPSDFDRAAKWVEDHRQNVPGLLESNDELACEAPTCEKLLEKLRSNDIDVLLHLEEALAADMTYLTTNSISDWLVEVAQAVEKAGIAQGLIIFWDEFTSVMDTLKSDRINLLQNIAEKSQNNNVFLYLISHRTESTASDAKGKDIAKMSDRYDIVDYAMDEISTYLILRHTFTIPDDRMLRETIAETKNGISPELYDYLCETDSTEERQHIQNLFPLHPYTAFLCSKLANIMGSANRSVLRFMNDEQCGFKKFIAEPTNFDQKLTLTADWLWDFFAAEFANEPSCAAFTNLFATQSARVDKMGDDYTRAFKAIMLLNALSIKFKSSPERYAPNDRNLHFIFSGDRCERQLDRILDWLDENKVVARDIFGEFKISVSAFNPAEIANEKAKVSGIYKTATDYLKYNTAARDDIARLFLVGERLKRKCDPQFYSCEETEAVLRSKIGKYSREKANHLHVTLFFAITEESRDMMENRIREFSNEFDNTLFIIPEEVFSTASQTHFIDAVTQSNVCRSHFNANDAAQFENAAREYVAKWKGRMNGGTYALFFRGNHYSDGIFSNIYQSIDRRLSPMVFPAGIESVKALQNASMTYFANKNAKSLSLQLLKKQTRDEMLAIGGAASPTKILFLDGENNLLTDTGELTETALAGSSWIATVCKETDRLIGAAKKKYADRFALSDILAPLMRAPFGMFANAPCYAALGFALRKHKDDLFDPSSSQPVSDEKLNDMIETLLKMWDSGNSESSNKLLLRFGSVEERNLTSLLGEVFNLNAVRGVNLADLKSLNYAKWSITEFCRQVALYPLWSLLYCQKIKDKDDCRKTLEDLISLFNQETFSLSKIKELYKELKGNQIEMYKLMSDNANYKEGFTAFINSIDGAEIKDEWWKELEEELNTMQSEIAFRNREDVRSRVLKFCLDKVREVQKPPVHTPPPPPTPIAKEPTPTVLSEETVKQAKRLVKEQTMPSLMWQKVVLDLLESRPEVAKFLVEYLNK